MKEAKEFVVYHGTDYKIAEIIVSNDFRYKKSKEHWLGNGIYFYNDLSLAEWWTTKPSNRFGSSIQEPAIIECKLLIEEHKLADLRNLKDYIFFTSIYRKEFIPQVFRGNILVDIDKESQRYNVNKLRCTFCDYFKDQFEIQAICGTFNLPEQPHLPKEYGERFNEFSLNYIETQFCVFDSSIITDKKIINVRGTNGSEFDYMNLK